MTTEAWRARSTRTAPSVFPDDGGVVVTVRVPLLAGPVDAEVARFLRLVGRLAARQGRRSVRGVPPPRQDSPSARGVPSASGGEVLRILPTARTVYLGDREVVLTRREFDLLWHLAEHPRQVFTRTQLLDGVWGHLHTGVRSVDVHVRRVRAKFGDDLPVICTVRGVGYRLGSTVPVEIVRDPVEEPTVRAM
ncbi:winged helix-turn-helix domain-containing protein [Micromonospora sp. NPDC049891]|uniref:winged helix-turn-helix domain-containing protein n=1 Tax=Micromonospora sp. NPDC049891 TaxID=3155655 RepID=UPI0033CF1BE9